MKEREIVYESETFDVINVEEFESIGIYKKIMNVGVLPYTLKNGIIDKIGVVEEYIPIRNEYKSNTLNILLGKLKNDDATVLHSATRTLKEISGIFIKDSSKWNFLGEFFTDILIDKETLIYAVDVSEIDNTNNDKFENKNFKKFTFVDVHKVILSKESLLLASYLRLFNLFYNEFNKK